MAPDTTITYELHIIDGISCERNTGLPGKRSVPIITLLLCIFLLHLMKPAEANWRRVCVVLQISELFYDMLAKVKH